MLSDFDTITLGLTLTLYVSVFWVGVFLFLLRWLNNDLQD